MNKIIQLFTSLGFLNVMICALIAITILIAYYCFARYLCLQKMREERQPVRNCFKPDIETDSEFSPVTNIIDAVGSLFLLASCVVFCITILKMI